MTTFCFTGLGVTAFFTFATFCFTCFTFFTAFVALLDDLLIDLIAPPKFSFAEAGAEYPDAAMANITAKATDLFIFFIRYPFCFFE